MNYSELVQLYFERSNALQSYWTLYVVIIGGLLAFASMRQRRDRVTTLLVTVLFIFFAYKNHGAIQDTSRQRLAVLESLREYQVVAGQQPPVEVTRSQRHIEPTLVQPDLNGIRNFHYTCDVLTVAALWAMERRRRLMAEEAKVVKVAT